MNALADGEHRGSFVWLQISSGALVGFELPRPTRLLSTTQPRAKGIK